MVILVTTAPQFSMNFHNSKNKNRIIFLIIFLILFSTLRIIHKSGIETEGDLLVVRWEIPLFSYTNGDIN